MSRWLGISNGFNVISTLVCSFRISGIQGICSQLVKFAKGRTICMTGLREYPLGKKNKGIWDSR